MRSSHLQALKGATILAGMVLGSPALAAQDTPAKPADRPAASGTEPETAEIVVTGSLISRRDYKSESPISTIDASAIKAAGSPSLDGVLGQMPQFAASQGASNSNPNVQGGGLSFAGGQSYSDLRGLGPNRSLVLLDGRRLMS